MLSYPTDQGDRVLNMFPVDFIQLPRAREMEGEREAIRTREGEMHGDKECERERQKKRGRVENGI